MCIKMYLDVSTHLHRSQEIPSRRKTQTEVGEAVARTLVALGRCPCGHLQTLATCLLPQQPCRDPLTCSPSWYWTAACIASSSLSTRSFQALFRESQAEFNYNINSRTLLVSFVKFSTTSIKYALVKQDLF